MLNNYSTYTLLYAVAQWLKCCATNRKVAGSNPASVSGIFIDIKSSRSHYGPGVDAAFNRNEYQEYFVGVKRPARKSGNLPPSCAVVTKSGYHNLLAPSGPVQACNGTALAFFTLYCKKIPGNERVLSTSFHNCLVQAYYLLIVCTCWIASKTLWTSRRAFAYRIQQVDWVD